MRLINVISIQCLKERPQAKALLVEELRNTTRLDFSLQLRDKQHPTDTVHEYQFKWFWCRLGDVAFPFRNYQHTNSSATNDHNITKMMI